jgi:hypothetical protein
MSLSEPVTIRRNVNDMFRNNAVSLFIQERDARSFLTIS